ncbi:Kinesin-like protein KIF22 [Cyphellophora attinorum]|uniref:Kinesin-like protein KIF22 n=1 Tax=Cyphellophora attinorum TaxID=1664694 RepID=A0A0N1HZW0_9EURO|nr:Kinesin-like protein KIF22 [Phialophora attinorum]KPI44487.1 Kinesin-like protein KIF22 [Phialophora attinorum]
MSVRVVARIRPLLKTERDVDQILTEHAGADEKTSIVKIPNPKNLSEEYSFQFSSVYGQESTQQQIFDAEVSPTIKQLFQGIDVTIFAYGSTGTGKTHTMRGGRALTDRGMIPRLLSSIFRKSKALEKSSNGDTTVDVSMSYYEIYNDRVFDLFEPPEKRNATGLAIREAEGGKTVVVGLTEEPCSTLKEFEVLYDRANANRSTGATKLNAHSSRSHAILCVKLTMTTPTETRVSVASAIDLAGSEDNRRTGNDKHRMVESASINKSLFVLAQCVEAIGKKQSRIPYRESKMTRILSLGQNNGICVMILNLAPTKPFHLDTLSSLNFANRTKKIEVKEVENEPIFKGPPRQATGTSGTTIQRQPLRPLTHVINVNLNVNRDTKEKPAKAFSVYSDRSRGAQVQKSSPLKRSAEHQASSRPLKQQRPLSSQPMTLSSKRPIPSGPTLSTANLEALIDSRVRSALATHTLAAPPPAEPPISDAVQARLDSIEKRLENVADEERAEGISFLFMAKQHQARGEDVSALKMYELASGYFPENEKLQAKIERLRERVRRRKAEEEELHTAREERVQESSRLVAARREQARNTQDGEDESYIVEAASDSEDDDSYALSSTSSPKRAKPRKKASGRAGKKQRDNAHSIPHNISSPDPLVQAAQAVPSGADGPPTPRMQHVLSIINSRDVHQIKQLQGVGPKRAEGIVGLLQELDEQLASHVDGHGSQWIIEDEQGLVSLKGVGQKGVAKMREGIAL